MEPKTRSSIAALNAGACWSAAKNRSAPSFSRRRPTRSSSSFSVPAISSTSRTSNSQFSAAILPPSDFARLLGTLLKLYDDQSVLVAEPGKPVQGLENIKQALMGFLALKLPIQLTVRRTYESGDVGLCVADWSIAGKGPDGKDVKLGGTSAEVVRKTSAGNWVYVIDSPYGTA